MEAGELIAERFQMLDMQAQTILGCAALLGYRPDIQLLAASAGASPAAATNALDLACGLDLVVRESRPPVAYRFRHALVQDAIRKAFGPDNARRTHARIGEALERLPDRAEHLEALAHHFSAAGDMGKSCMYRDLAGQDAGRLGV